MVRLLVGYLLFAGLLSAGTSRPVPLPLVFAPAGESANGPAWFAIGEDYSAEFYPIRVRYRSRGVDLQMEFVNASARTKLEGTTLSSARVHRILGREPISDSLSSASYQNLWYRDLYPGVHARISGERGRMKSEFLVEPGRPVEAIRIRYQGVTRMWLDRDGSLILETPEGQWREDAPVLFQDLPEGRREIRGSFAIGADGTIGFHVGEYDPSWPLWIDPVLSVSLLLGGLGNSTATSITTDVAGNVYVAGYTDALDFAGVTPARGSGGGVDAVVAKLHGGTGQLLYVTYIGGFGDDRALAVKADAAGNVWVAGHTTSPNFPVELAVQGTLQGYRDAFLLTLDSSGSALRFSTYLGGTGNEAANALAVSGSAIYVAGNTDSTDYPVLEPLQYANRGRQDAFVAKYSLSGSLLFSTYLGGAGDEQARALSVDGQGNLIVGGSTDSANYPVMQPLQSTLRGGQDGFLSKISSSGTGLLFSTYLGGSKGGVGAAETIEALAMGPDGSIFAGGSTPSEDFPVVSAIQGVHAGGGSDGFLAQIDAAGSQILRATFYGGSGRDMITALVVDGTGRVYAAGSTTSYNLPLANAYSETYRGGIDGFVSGFELYLSTQSLGTYLGGSIGDSLNSLALLPSGDLWMAGLSGSGDFPVVGGSTPSGSSLRWVVGRFTFGIQPAPTSVSPSGGSGLSQSFSFVFKHPGGANQISGVEMNFENGWTAQSACFVRHYTGSGQLLLASDSGTDFTAVTIGSAMTAENSQCSISGTGSGVTANGTDLTIVVNATFKPAYKGVRSIRANATDSALRTSGPVALGTFTVVGSQPPMAVGATPGNAMGMGGQFTYSFSDPNGGKDIAGIHILYSATGSTAGACLFYYLRDSNTLALADDQGLTYSTIRGGTSDAAQNSQCVINGSGVSSSVSGLSFMLNTSVSFKTSFGGTRNLYIAAWDRDGLGSGWALAGTYTVSNTGNATPTVGSTSPVNGTGAATAMTFRVYDADGAADILGVQVLINRAWIGSGACFVFYQRGTNVVAVADDAQSLWTPVRLGTTDMAENSQCRVSGIGSSTSETGTEVNLTLNLTFKPAFAGTKRIYVNAWDRLNAASGPNDTGSWLVNEPPAFVSLSPSQGSGTGTRFSVRYSDPNGGNDLAALYLLFAGGNHLANACLLYHERGSGLVYLVDDAGATMTPVRLGTSDNVQNSQCTLSGAGSSATVATTQYTLDVALTFSTSVLGKLNIYSGAVDQQGANVSAGLAGSYTVSGNNQKPMIVTVSPATGSGSSQVFALTLSDPDGPSDIAGAQLLANTSLAAGGSCLVAWDRSANTLKLASDSMENWFSVSLGSTAKIQNSYCELSGSGSEVTEYSTTVTVRLNIRFLPTARGNRNLYVNVWDRKQAATGFTQRGAWQVP